MRRSVLLTACLILIFIIFNLDIIVAQEWSPPLMISDSAFGNFPQIIANGDTMHVVYENAIKLNSHTVILSYIRSTDAGISWSNPIIISDTSFNSEFPRIIRNENRIIVIWMNRYSEYYHYSDKKHIIFQMMKENLGAILNVYWIPDLPGLLLFAHQEMVNIS
jgi:hypothetical protein